MRTSEIVDNREFKQTRRRRQRERHPKMKLCVSAIISQFSKSIRLKMCSNFLEQKRTLRFRVKKTKFNISYHMPTSSPQLENWSFHVVERTRTSAKRTKMENARAMRAKLCFSLSKM